MSNEYSDIQELIDDLLDNRDILFEYQGKMYFIDYLYFKKNRKYNRIRSIGEFDGYGTTEESRHTYDTVDEMLDNYYIDGKRLRDIIMDARIDSIY